jgi:YjjG family noncanonical pyrimidine nucleotidase
MGYDVVFLDADGTVWDFKASQKIAFRTVMKAFGVIQDLDAIYLRYHEINEELWVRLEQGSIKKEELRVKRYEEVFREYGLKLPAEQVSQAYLTLIAQGKDLIDGAEEICRYLSQRYRLVMVTNGMTETQHSRMDGSILEPYFEKMIVSDDIAIAKPDPRIFEYAMDAIAFKDKDKVIMIGDSLSADIAGGHAFGIDTCWVNPSGKVNERGFSPTYEIRDIRNLKEIL